MNAKHTPGPWLAREGDTMNHERTWGIVRVLTPEEHGCDPAEGERTEVIAEVYDTPDKEIMRRDAYLLAAAPAMLEALRQIAQGDRLTSTQGLAKLAYEQCVSLAREAIKATQEER